MTNVFRISPYILPITSKQWKRGKAIFRGKRVISSLPLTFKVSVVC